MRPPPPQTDHTIPPSVADKRLRMLSLLASIENDPTSVDPNDRRSLLETLADMVVTDPISAMHPSLFADNQNKPPSTTNKKPPSASAPLPVIMWTKCFYERINELRKSLAKAHKAAPPVTKQQPGVFNPKTSRLDPVPIPQLHEANVYVKFLEEGVQFFVYMIDRFVKKREGKKLWESGKQVVCVVSLLTHSSNFQSPTSDEREMLFSQSSNSQTSQPPSQYQSQSQSTTITEITFDNSLVAAAAMQPTEVECCLQRLQICIGDVTRYLAQHKKKFDSPPVPPPSSPSFSSSSTGANLSMSVMGSKNGAELWKQPIEKYLDAIQTDPGTGNAYNQLAVVYQNKGEEVTSYYYYVRALMGREPFVTAENNMRKVSERSERAL